MTVSLLMIMLNGKPVKVFCIKAHRLHISGIA